MSAVFKREFKSYFSNMTGCICIAVLFAFISLLAWIICLLGGYPQFEMVLSNIWLYIILAVVVSVLTMRVFSAERRSKTDQLLLTAPVSVYGIVMGKYLAMLAVFAIPVAGAAILPLILSAFGSLAWGTVYSTLFAFLLLGATLIAIGMFISSLFENQIVTVVVSLVVTIFLLLLPSIINSISNQTSAFLTGLTTVLGWLTVFTRMENFASGIFDLTAVIYYISICAAMVFFTVRSIESRRWN